VQDVRQIAKQIVAREGGYVNDPADPGGPTNHGVTLATLRRLGLDLDGNGQVDGRDLRALKPAEAVDIFITHYFKAPGIDGLPAPLHPSVFDMYVNAGGNAVRILQELLREMGLKLAVDGMIGAETRRMAARALRMAPDHLVDAYGIARRNYYYHLGDINPRLRKFARRRDGGKGGWITRAEGFIAPRFRLSDAEHRARVAAWL